MQSQEMPLCRNRQKFEFTGAYFTRSDPSELLLEPGEVEIRCAVDVKLVMLVCEAEPAPGFPSCSSGVFLQDTRGLPPRDRTVRFWLSPAIGWLGSLGCCKYFLFHALLQPQGV